jgi:hypothetical protein
LIAVVEYSFLFLLLEELHVPFVIILNSDQIEDVSQQRMLDLPIHWGGGAE